jgi:hypothetical protein
VPIDKIVPHEIEDESRAQPLIKRLPQDGVLRNPPVVTESGRGNYVILDGTNRVMALDALKFKDALVQVVRYEEPYVELHTWNHVIIGMDSAQIRDRLAALSGLEVKSVDAFHAKAALARRSILSYLICANEEVIALACTSTDIAERTRLLQQVVDVYVAGGQLHRTNLDDIPSIKSLYPEMAATFIFPRYEPVEILELAETGLPVPTGITRHVIHGRALRMNYPLDRLAADQALEDKNRELAEWVREQFARKRVRYYAESTYLFDE